MPQTPKTAAEYQAEMLQLYRRAHPEESESVAVSASAIEPELEIRSDTSAKPEESSAEIFAEQSIPDAEDAKSELNPESETALESETPEEIQIEGTGAVSDFPALQTEEVPLEEVVLEPVPPLHPNLAYGFLKVITRTAREAMPMPNVTVTVSAIEAGETRLYYTTTTNESGETEAIPLPAPVQMSEETAMPNQIPFYRNYDVSIDAPGYFRMESHSLPIFAGITSLQKFAMIPLPQFSDASNQTVVYQNPEPRGAGN